MEQKIYILENLDCANCAAKIESKFNALPEVQEATITFPTRQLRLTADNPDALIEKLTAIARTVESEVTILPREDHHHHEHHTGCCCGHEHHHEDCNCGHGHHEGCTCGHEGHHEHHHEHGSDDKKALLVGAGLFAVGVVLNTLNLPIAAIPAFLLAYIILGREVLAAAWKNLIKGHVFAENFLMSVATLGALLIQEWPEAVGVMLFYRIGEYFEEKAVERSRSQTM